MNLLVYLLLLISPAIAIALEDDLKKSIEIAAKGSGFQAERLKVAAENIANENTTANNPNEMPYRRKVVFGVNQYDKKTKADLLKVKKIDTDKSSFVLRYEPNHPAANEDGYVKYPNVNKEIERADSIEAARSYEANLSVIQTSNSMIQKTIEAIK